MSAGNRDLIDSLKGILAAGGANAALWEHLGDLQNEDADFAAAAESYRTAVGQGPVTQTLMLKIVAALRKSGQFGEAVIRAESMLAAAPFPALAVELARVLLARGDLPGAREQYQAAIAEDPSQADATFAGLLAQVTPAGVNVEPPSELLCAGHGHDPASADTILAELGLRGSPVKFDDVVGLADVKNQIHLRIVAPFKRPDVYRAFGRQAGGGLLLYGPPGCGKTYIARATAGECSAAFTAVSIHELVDKYFGESEKLVHALFEQARRNAPTILFFDEFDAVATSRGRSGAQFWRTLVNQILVEMDGLAGNASGVLVFAATNLPWNVDAAFRRPGRFDRALFVPPPDAAGREQLLKHSLAQVPGGDAIDVQQLVRRTELFTGADLAALVERAAERALAASLSGDTVHNVAPADLEAALSGSVSSALEWLVTARNYARYANEGQCYDELVGYLKSVKRW